MLAVATVRADDPADGITTSSVPWDEKDAEKLNDDETVAEPTVSIYDLRTGVLKGVFAEPNVENNSEKSTVVKVQSEKSAAGENDPEESEVGENDLEELAFGESDPEELGFGKNDPEEWVAGEDEWEESVVGEVYPDKSAGGKNESDMAAFDDRQWRRRRFSSVRFLYDNIFVAALIVGPDGCDGAMYYYSWRNSKLDTCVRIAGHVADVRARYSIVARAELGCKLNFSLGVGKFKP